MAEDIRRHLRSEPILARPTGSFYHLRKFARRNKILVGGVATTILALALGLTFTAFFAHREVRQRRIAEEMSARSEHEATAKASDALADVAASCVVQMRTTAKGGEHCGKGGCVGRVRQSVHRKRVSQAAVC